MAQITEKLYACRNCGHVQRIKTNHTGPCFDYCHECSWKMGWRKSGIYGVDDGLDVPMFGHMYRPFDYVAPVVYPIPYPLDLGLNDGDERLL